MCVENLGYARTTRQSILIGARLHVKFLATVLKEATARRIIAAARPKRLNDLPKCCACNMW